MLGPGEHYAEEEIRFCVEASTDTSYKVGGASECWRPPGSAGPAGFQSAVAFTRSDRIQKSSHGSEGPGHPQSRSSASAAGWGCGTDRYAGTGLRECRGCEDRGDREGWADRLSFGGGHG